LKHKNIFQWEGMCLDGNLNFMLIFEDSLKIGLRDLLIKLEDNEKVNYSEKLIIFIFSGIFECFAKAKAQRIFHGFITSSHFAFVQDEKNHNFILKITGFDLSLNNNINAFQEDEMISKDEMDFEDLNKKYSAPELYNLKPTYNPYQADVFSLGIVLLEMMGLTNENLQIMRKQRFTNFNPHLDLVYPHLLPIVKKMLKYDHNQRISFQEIYNELVILEINPTEESKIMGKIIELKLKDKQEKVHVFDIKKIITDQKKGTVMKCEKYHDLVWSKMKETYGEEFVQCDLCKKKTLVKNGRWFCLECDYNICPKCRRVPLEETKTCNENHPLVWHSTQGGYPYPLYWCDLCRMEGNIFDGRWHCEACTYDLCNCCRGPEQKF